jgi:antitoxin (DNA-binding transcriptional repressor) of toxin-antitoxin stability system
MQHAVIFPLQEQGVKHTVSTMKTITMSELNRRTAKVLDEVERGETFELRRKGKAVAYLMHTPRPLVCKPDWQAHLDWLRNQPREHGGFLKELDDERQRTRAREIEFGNLQ